ncbi:MAG TPA: hypothetical protein VNT26_01010 [Candidatus Sulfotelmatobacter sp.]|nr:hypothetical protein [Candidatus Sulfotelmatobacter sp.]
MLAIAMMLAGCVLAGTGCRVVKGTAKLPVTTVKAVVPGKQTTPVDPALLEADLQRYAIDFAGRTASALEEYARRVNTPEGRTQAQNWKLGLDSSALIIATGPNPTANLLDFLALATLTRAFLEDRASSAGTPGALDPWLETSRLLETNAWKLAQGVFTPRQQAECRDAIRRWRAQNAQAGTSFFVRPQAFTSAIRQSAQQTRQPESVFSLVGLDPTAGLDPAVREVTRTRLFAERALFAAQCLPILMRWNVESLADQLLRQEQVSAGLQSVERLSRAAELASQTAALLPDRLSAERQAILEALQAQESKLSELSTSIGQTLAAGEKMSASLNTTILTFDALMQRLGIGEHAGAPPKTNATPFNILDYGRTAEQIASMAQQLDTLIQDATATLETPALDKRLASLHALSARTRADAKSVLNYAFCLTAVLIVLGFACALAYRHLASRARATDAEPRMPVSNRSSP